jgi:hypothetical protein
MWHPCCVKCPRDRGLSRSSVRLGPRPHFDVFPVIRDCTVPTQLPFSESGLVAHVPRHVPWRLRRQPGHNSNRCEGGNATILSRCRSFSMSHNPYANAAMSPLREGVLRGQAQASNVKVQLFCQVLSYSVSRRVLP